MNKLLVVCGPTATGKTSVALKIAKEINGELISADSRQVYKGMDIGTGKDIPKGAKYKTNTKLGGYYEADGVKIWGYDLVSPKREYSVADYSLVVRKIMKDVWKRKKTVVMVGGTGFYINAVIDGIETAGIPKNESLRKNLEKLSVNELFEKLALLDAVKAASLNTSDRKNPRRLVRAIEVAQWQLTNKSEDGKGTKLIAECSLLVVGLKASKKELEMLIGERVDKRMKMGMIEEIKELIKSGVSWSDQSMNALGYKQMKRFFNKSESIDKAVVNWKKEEYKYSKRQMTWFSKDKRIKWFNIKGKDYPENMENYVLKWYKG